MRIDCYLSEDCPTGSALKKNIEYALHLEAVAADISVHRIDEVTAVRLGITGSPTVMINGEDIQPGDKPGLS
jgi:hypothetical protein